jgi:Activator of Hsp90 ATPase homolog 1-like protein
MTTKKSGSISSEAVRKATGRSWDEWYAILDAVGAKAMTHQQIAAVLRDRHNVGPWWEQMVTVGYEQARGKRVKHQRPDGFSINRSKTIAAKVADAFAAWTDPRRRREWLADGGFTIRKATANKSLRITWIDGATNLDVQFVAKGRDKCQVTLEHARLKSEKAAEKMKAYWGQQLEKLKSLLES